MSAPLNVYNVKPVVITDWFGEIDEFIGVLTPQFRAVKTKSLTGTCQYCARVGLPLHVEKAGGRFHMHCQECIEWPDSIANDVYDDEDVRDDVEWDDDYDDCEPEGHECACCGSISYTRSVDGYCGSCRSYEKQDSQD